MKKLLLFVLCAILLCSMCSCALIGGLGLDQNGTLNNVGNKVQDIFGEGVNTLQSLLNKTVIESSGSVIDKEAGKFIVNDDSITVIISPAELIKKIEAEGITKDSITKERKNAELAKLDYTLAYQCIVKFKIEDKFVYAAASIPVNAENLYQNIQINIPIDKDKIAVTAYDLLQGGTLDIESCLKHGTECSNAINEVYTIASSENSAPYVLTFTDARKG